MRSYCCATSSSNLTANIVWRADHWPRPHWLSSPAIALLGINLCTRSRTYRETPVEARAGFLYRPTLVVLIVSTSLTITLCSALHWVFYAVIRARFMRYPALTSHNGSD
jgi:hypothetical protein